MKLPCAKKAVISVPKLKNYLLSESHPVGRLKAKFFHKYGFNKENVALLEKELRAIVENEKVKKLIESNYGIKYIIDGDLHGITKQKVRIRTVWIREFEERLPRFVTAYPL